MSFEESVPQEVMPQKTLTTRMIPRETSQQRSITNLAFNSKILDNGRCNP